MSNDHCTSPDALHVDLARQHDAPRRRSRVALHMRQSLLGALLQRHAEFSPALGSIVPSAHTPDYRPPLAAFLICATSLWRSQEEIDHPEAAALPLASSGPASLAKATGAWDDRMIFRRAGDIELHRHPLILFQECRRLRFVSRQAHDLGDHFPYYTALPYIRSIALGRVGRAPSWNALTFLLSLQK